MPLHTPYDRYKIWNEALLNYYFDENDPQQVILCVDANVIEDVGRKTREITNDLREGQTYLDHFLKYTCPKFEERQGFPVSNRTLNMLITGMIDYSTASIHFFGFTILLVFLYAIEGSENAIKRKTQELSGDRFTRFECLVEMWNILGKRYNRFESDRLTGNQPYVGRLKFHTVLRKRFKDEFLSLLINNNLKWNEQEESFEQFINYKLGPILLRERELLGAIRTHLNNPDTLFYFESIVRNCNYSQDPNRVYQYTRFLLFVYNHRSNQLYLKIEGEDSTYLYEDNGLKPYLVDDIFYVNRPSVKYERYDNVTLDIPNGPSNAIYSTTNKSYRLLKKVDDNIFEEVLDAEDGHCYLFITSSPNDLGRINNQNSINITNKVTAFGKGVMVMLIKRWHGRQSNELQGEEQIVSSSYPKLRGGIRSTSEPRAYIPSALPIIEFEDEQHANYAEIVCRQDPELSPNIEITQEISGKHIYLTLSGSSPAIKTEWEICIRNKETGDVLLNRNIQIHHTFPDIPAPQFGFDRYGVERHVERLLPMPNSQRANGQQLQTGIQEPSTTSPLLDILIQLSNNGVVSQEHLKKAVSYTLKIKGKEVNSYNRRKVINDLTDLGYIIGYWNNITGRYENQLCQPKLHKTQTKLTLRYNSNAYILTGCYSKALLNSLKKDIEDVKAVIEARSTTPAGVDTSCIQYRYVSECIPDLVLIQPADIRSFSERCNIELIDHPYAFDLIKYSATINDCINKYLIDNDDRRPYNEKFTVPRIVNGDNYKILIWKQGQTEIYQTDHYLDTEDYNIRKEIPEEFMKSYIQLQTGKAVAILEPNATDYATLRLEHFFKTITFTSYMGIPKVLKRALCELNQGCPDKRKCFIVNAAESNISSNYIYTECETYSIKAEATDIVKILTGTETRDWNTVDTVFITKNTKDVKLEIKDHTIESDWYILKMTKGNSYIKVFFKFGKGEQNDTCVMKSDERVQQLNVNRSNFNEFMSKLISTRTKAELLQCTDNYFTNDYNEELTEHDGRYEELVIFNKR